MMIVAMPTLIAESATLKAGNLREVDEVGHLAEADAVEEVARGAAEQHADGDWDDPVVERREAVVEVDGGDARETPSR